MILKRILLVCVTLTALSFGASALPPCQQYIHVHVQQWERNRVTKRTQKRWDAWNKTHPNFKPHPRPAYRMTTEELTYKLDFDCPSPVPVTFDVEPYTPVLELAPPVADSVVFAESPVPPPIVPAIPSLTASLEVPIAAPVPEPSSLLAVLTGAVSLLCAMLIERWMRAAGR